MSIQQHWATKVAARVMLSAVGGGIIVAIAGAGCVGAVGALLGWILDIRSTPPAWDMGYLFPGAWLGASLGSWGGIVGAIAAAVITLSAAPGNGWKPLRAPLMRIAAGQIAGTLAALSSYLLLALVLAQSGGHRFVGTVEDNLELAVYGVPALMFCGAIAGALWKPAMRNIALREAL